MRHRTTGMLTLVFGALLFLAACGSPGLSEEDAQEIRDDINSAQDRLDDLESQLTALQDGEEDPEAVAEEGLQNVEQMRSTLDEAEQGLEPAEEAAPAVDDPAAPADPALDDPAADPAAPAP